MVSNWKYMWLLLSSVLTAIWFYYRLTGCHILYCSHSVKYLCHSSHLLQDKETDYLHLCLGIIHILSVLLLLNLSYPYQQANSSLNHIIFVICIFLKAGLNRMCLWGVWADEQHFKQALLVRIWGEQREWGGLLDPHVVVASAFPTHTCLCMCVWDNHKWVSCWDTTMKMSVSSQD